MAKYWKKNNSNIEAIMKIACILLCSQLKYLTLSENSAISALSR